MYNTIQLSNQHVNVGKQNFISITEETGSFGVEQGVFPLVPST